MNPYQSLNPKHFWSTAVAQKNMFDIADLWDPKFRIGRRMKVATYGSCFAQHIGKALAKRGFTWMITERAPSGLSDANAKKFNYGVFTARTGNIYTVSLLNQWLDWALLGKQCPNEIWEKNGRFFDPFRPSIEPNGFESPDEVRNSRVQAVEAFRQSIIDSDIFVFTLGLTESWLNKAHGYEYPLCPGTVAGEFDDSIHKFENQEYTFIRNSLLEAINKMKNANSKLKFLLTVSPVPLTATMSGNHILVATMESKSILRAVAGSVANRSARTDYFPSYEIINSTPFRGSFFEPNQRNVNHAGVDHVMKTFFSSLKGKFQTATPGVISESNFNSAHSVQDGLILESSNRAPANLIKDDLVCEEELLGAFSSAERS